MTAVESGTLAPSPPRDVDDVLQRVYELREHNREVKEEQRRIRAIIDGGVTAVQELIGEHAPDLRDMPVGDYLGKALDSLALRLGHPPDLRIDTPTTGDIDDDAHKDQRRSEKLMRIVASYDEACELDLMLPQLARWLPGYGFAAIIVRGATSIEGHPYPHAELRDPYETYPAPWGANQQPPDVAFIRELPLSALIRMYPEHENKLLQRRRPTGPGGAALLGGPTDLGHQQTWENPARGGIEIVEYHDEHGEWWVVPEVGLLLERVPNELDYQTFYVAKRFSFNKLRGQYDNVIGLMSMLAKQNLLAEIATTDNVFSETNVYGEILSGQYDRGRFALNKLEPGARVEKPQNNVPIQLFQQIERLENQLRIGAHYPETADAQAPTSWITGAGLEGLDANSTRLTEEYQVVISHALQHIDALRLEMDEKRWSEQERPLVGEIKGAQFAESYKPKTHIKGQRRTRRVYGAMAGWDQPQKIVTGLQLMQGGIIDTTTMQENIDGLGDLAQVRQRIRAERAEEALFNIATSNPDPGQVDQRWIMALIDQLPPGPTKDKFEKYFTERGEEMSEQEQRLARGLMQGEQSPEEMQAQQPPDPATVMSRLTGGGAEGGVQTVGELQR